MLRYRLEAVYSVLPACAGTDLEDTLDRVSADLHPHDVRLWSSSVGVHVVLEVHDDDVLEVYGQVAEALEHVVAALRRQWPCRPQDGSEPSLRLTDASQSFL